MDHMIRNWMIIIGFCLIMVVLLDALRRVFKDRRDEVRLNAKISRRDLEDLEDDSFNLLTELPNGGARIVSRTDLQPAFEGQDGEVAQATVEPAVAPSDGPEIKPPDEVPKEDLDEWVQNPSAGSDTELELPSFSARDDDEQPAVDVDPVPLVQDDAPEIADDDLPAQGDSTLPGEESSAIETMDWLEGLEVPEAEPEPEARLPRDVDPHVFVLNVMSRSEVGFSGSDILGVLLACDLRFGDMDFFHRHEHRAGRGPIQFSVCNMLKPGVFNIDDMGSLRTRGLMFFITLPGPEDMLKAFDYMHETAKAVAKNLDGYLLDETRSGVTRQSIEHMRQQIRELERRVALQKRR
ncbi:MAG: cell division protein ZipA [Luminiphilus sp.]|nr:cell division protein ZipA [Luminiphilus sp.]MDG2493982.1 cell division protein ZipA [Luminiphilus sp.]